MHEIAPTHPVLSFWLEVLDKLIKLAAVALGGLWTWWNYRKSRTYAQKMELTLAASAFRRDAVYLEIEADVKNLGAARHVVEAGGTYCEIAAVYEDESETTIKFVELFIGENSIEPGETISDLLLLRLPAEAEDALWLRINLRVVSRGVEWRQVASVRLIDMRPVATERENRDEQ